MAEEVVAIVGAGNIGRRLGARLRTAGVDVRYGVRDPDRPEAQALGASSMAAAVSGASVVLLTVPAAAAIEAARALGPLRDVVLLDCTNPMRWDSGPVWNPPREGSVAAALAAALPQVAVIKGLNYFGAEIHENPRLAAGPADAFFAGDNKGAKSRVMALADRIGFRAVDAGPLRNAAVLENLAVLWIQLASTGGLGRQFAFRIDGR